MNGFIGMTLKFTLATVLVMLGTMLIGGTVFAVLGNPWPDVPEAGDVLLPMLASSALLVIALIAPVRASALPRWPRVAAVFVAGLGVNVLLMQVEAAAFLDMTALQLAVAVINATAVAAWLSLVAGILFGTRDGRPAAGVSVLRTAWRPLSWRIVACATAYLLLYIVAGMAVYPKVADYYTAQNFEAGPWIVPLAFIRGALYVVFSLWLIRSLDAPRLYTALAVAVMFPLLAGVAALIVPNAFMPPEVRLWHAIEVGCSNFVFGFLVGWLFWRGATSFHGKPSAAGPVVI